MSKRLLVSPILLAAALACPCPGLAQDNRDPLTRFIHDLLSREKAETSGSAVVKPAAPAQEAIGPEQPRREPPQALLGGDQKGAEPKARLTSSQAARMGGPISGPGRSVPVPRAVAAQTPLPWIPASPEAAVDRVNAYFSSIDQLTASFVQHGPNGRSEGTLQLKRPGQLRFAYAPPSTLEIVSDGRSVAIRDSKLGTNDVYPVGQTPLKFLLQERFDLTRDTMVRDVQASPDGVISIRFEDSTALGGTSEVTLRFDAQANKLRQWSIVDPQGFQTTVILSDLMVVRR